MSAATTCPIVTPYTGELGVLPNILEKLWEIRTWDIEAVKNGELNPIPFRWPSLLKKEFMQQGEWHPLELRQYQLQQIFHMTRMPRFINGDGVGLGKAQPLDAKILTPSGWKKMGDLQIGDPVCDPDGGTGVVEGIFPQGIKEVFRLSTKDGSTECCDEHLWTVQTVHDRADDKYRTLSTRQLIDKGLYEINGPEGWRRNIFFLPRTKPIEFISQTDPIIIPPYTLGVLLGDGSFRNDTLNLTAAEEEIARRVESQLPSNLILSRSTVSPKEWHIRISELAMKEHFSWLGKKSCAKRWKRPEPQRPLNTINPYIEESRRLGLMEKYSHEKYIPERYMKGSIPERMDLLKGLMDTDGECNSVYGAYFSSTSLILAQQVQELVRSLGGQANLSSCGKGKYRTESGELKVCRESWSVSVKTDFAPFYLKRKVDSWKLPLFARPILSIEPVGKKECQCIRVSTKRHLYITDDYLPTHNTIDVIAAACWLKERNPNLKFLVLCTKSTSLQWGGEFLKFSNLRPFVMVDEYRGQKSYAARLQQFEHFLQGDKKDVLITKYTSVIGKRKKIKGGFDDDGNPVKDGVESISEEIRQFCNIAKAHRENLVVILDECQKFKGLGTSIRKLVANLCNRTDRVWALTATAVKNDLEEFYSIASAVGIRPFGLVGDFREQFCLYDAKHIGFGQYEPVLRGYKNVKEFRAGLRPFFLGRSQAQVKEKLPKLSTTFVPIDLSEEQINLLLHDIPDGTYVLPPTIVKTASGDIIEKERDPDNLMTMMSVYQLVANHPGLLDPGNPEKYLTKKLSPKEEELLYLLDGELAGEKCIVYTKYRTWIDRLEHITKQGWFTNRQFLRITGAENETKRDLNKRLFQETAEHDLMVINNAAVEGVNLQQAAHMILLDLPWSWGDLIQLVGRMVRMASPHSACTLWVLTAKGTMDEYTIEVLKGKKGVFETILGESHSAGILDNNLEIDLDSGMDQVGTDEEFHKLLKAHVRSVGVRTFIQGDMLLKAKNNPEYRMTFEKKEVTPKKNGSFKSMQEAYKSKWDF